MPDKQIDLISVVDDNGKKGSNLGAEWSRAKGDYSIGIRHSKTARKLDLILAIHESIYLDYQVAPELIYSNASPASPSNE
ncbi:MAG: hypothetical protein CMO80_04670 [Verrucomicrobiales bacterium]|nr:hypothetical protein [Verrucomicrobiales bacterium]|tara:strand:- start:7655 stop:7894 length:240 start_codon:yes stop_codon:yes gene_type:complete